MSRSPDVERVLRLWLADDGAVAPDRILQVVADRVANQPRQSASRTRGSHTMKRNMIIAAGVAASIVLALAAWQLLPPGDAVGGPSGSPALNSTPATSARVLTTGPLTPATWVSRVADVQISFELPAGAEGWEGGGTNFLGVQPLTEPPDGVFLGFNVVTRVPQDPCRSHLTAKPVGGAVEDLSAFWSTLPHAQITGPTKLVVSGFEGVRFVLELDENLADCVVEAIGLYYAGSNVRVVGAGQHVELWAIDVDGTRLVVEASSYPGADPEHRRVLEEIVDSISLTPAG